MNQLTDTERNSMNREDMIQTIDALCSYVARSIKKTYKRVKASEQDHMMNLAVERGNYVLDYAHRLKANLIALPVVATATDLPAAVPAGYVLVKVQHEDRDGFWSYSDNEEDFVGEECDTELDAIAAALDYYGDDLETVYVGKTKQIDKARLVRGDQIIEMIRDAADEEVGECAYDWPHLSNDECAELERIVMGYVLSKSPAGFFSVENSREYTREQAEEMLAAAETRGAWQRIRTRIAEAQDDASEESQFPNHYRCPSCQHEWDSQWSATCDDECPNCGASNISPWRSEDL